MIIGDSTDTTAAICRGAIPASSAGWPPCHSIETPTCGHTSFGPHPFSVQSTRPSNLLAFVCIQLLAFSRGRWAIFLDFTMQFLRPSTISFRPLYINPQLFCVASAMLAKVISPAAPGGPAKAFLIFSHCLGDYTVFAHM